MKGYKGGISLQEFISKVKQELIATSEQEANDPRFILEKLDLETAFTVETETEGGFKFVIDLKGSAKASQLHKVKITLKPIKGGGSILGKHSEPLDISNNVNNDLSLTTTTLKTRAWPYMVVPLPMSYGYGTEPSHGKYVFSNRVQVVVMPDSQEQQNPRTHESSDTNN